MLLLLVLEYLCDGLLFHIRCLSRLRDARFSDRLFLTESINQLVQGFELELASGDGDQVVVLGLLILRLR